jgi:hypothetical protein
LGTKTASGSVWLNDEVKAGEFSEPFLFAGWPNRATWIQNSGENQAEFVFEVDKDGTQAWTELKTVSLEAGESRFIEFNNNELGEWIRIKTKAATVVTASFNYSGSENRQASPAQLFDGLAKVTDAKSEGGLLYGLGDDRRALGIFAVKFENEKETETGYYELDEHLNLVKKDDPETNTFIKEKFAISEKVIDVEESSVLIIDDKNRRWRLPLGDVEYKQLTDAAQLRICREVATERDLFHSNGTFYELPAENADGFAKIRPVASHNFRIHDYASYRGLLVMTGIDPDTNSGEHIVRSDDGQAAVWLGAIDDLWEMGKPVGKGGPWKDTNVKAGEPSDPYLIGFYDDRSLEISHDASEQVTFKIEVEPIGHGPWMLYEEVTAEPGETFSHQFPVNFQARWIRFVADKNCSVTAWLEYK